MRIEPRLICDNCTCPLSVLIPHWMGSRGSWTKSRTFALKFVLEV